jgi:cytochrome c oxidase subunit 3
MEDTKYETYYVPEQSIWPAVGAVALFLIGFGAASLMGDLKADGNGNGLGKPFLFSGLAVLFFFLWGWFRDMINESLSGKYSLQVGKSYRQGMVWFIGSEVMFFAAFFGALFYLRNLSVPWLAGADNNVMTHVYLWADFIPSWPLIETPGGKITTAMPPWGLPLINTILLVSSSITLTYAHHALIDGNRKRLLRFMYITVALGLSFLFLQAEEYVHAYTEMNLRLDSGVYGSTFFMLTGFHGMHVTLGTIMLIVMTVRSFKNHFTAKNHFAFEAAAWYWHFVDVVWIGLYIFVYIL